MLPPGAATKVIRGSELAAAAVVASGPIGRGEGRAKIASNASTTAMERARMDSR